MSLPLVLSTSLFETGLIISLELPDQVIRLAGGKFHRPTSLFLPLWGQDYRCAPRYPVFMWVPRPELRASACAASTLPAESSPPLLAMNSMKWANSVQHKVFVPGGRLCRRNSECGLCQLITVAFPLDLDIHNLVLCPHESGSDSISTRTSLISGYCSHSWTVL